MNHRVFTVLFSNEVTCPVGLLFQSCCRLQESALMEMLSGRPCSSRRANRHLRRGEVGKCWTLHTLRLNWRRATLFCLVQLVQVSLVCNTFKLILSDTLCNVFVLCPSPDNFMIHINFHRKDIVGADTGTLSGCSICNLRLHHTNSSWICGRGHRVGYCQTPARCQLLSGKSTARWAEGLYLQNEFPVSEWYVCLLSKKRPVLKTLSTSSKHQQYLTQT